MHNNFSLSVLVKILAVTPVEPYVPNSDFLKLQLELRDNTDILAMGLFCFPPHSITAVFTQPAVLRRRHPCRVEKKS